MREPERRSTAVEPPWWLAAPELLQDLSQQPPHAPRTVVSYQMGEAVLQVAVDDRRVLSTLQELYADCEAPTPLASTVRVVRCTVRRRAEPPLVLLTFQAGAPIDPAGAAYSFLRVTCAEPPFRVYDSPRPGWRLAGGATGPLLAASGNHVLIDPRQVPPEFLVEYLMGIALATQHEVLPLHGASLLIGDAGLVLAGPTRAGKTTTALHLAARGHVLLGDEITLLRLDTNELLPFRRTANLRPGPYGQELAAALGFVGKDGEGEASSPGAGPDVAWCGPRRISEMFPGRPARPGPLRAVFFLGGFDSRPSLEPFRLTVDRDDIFDWLTTSEIAQPSWRLEPARRALRLLALREALARVPCWLLKVGPPRETTEVIERTMEGHRC